MTKIILDTDLAMGDLGADVDDGFALALAIADPDIDLLAVTTVNGNTDVHSATRLSHRLLDKIGYDVPVYQGADRPLLRKPNHPIRDSEYEDVHAAMAIIDAIRRHPHEVTLVLIGPLTNIALALRLDPGIAPLIKEAVIMGGVFLRHTNESGMPGEFNIWVDPEAARIVAESGMPLKFVGLDVTLQVRIDLDDAAALERSESAFAQYAGASTRAWIDFMAKRHPDSEPDQTSCAMHDPLAVVAVTQPDIVTWSKAYVTFATESEVTRGMAVADLLREENPPEPNCVIATEVDADRFRSLFISRLQMI